MITAQIDSRELINLLKIASPICRDGLTQETVAPWLIIGDKTRLLASNGEQTLNLPVTSNPIRTEPAAIQVNAKTMISAFGNSTGLIKIQRMPDSKKGKQVWQFASATTSTTFIQPTAADEETFELAMPELLPPSEFSILGTELQRILRNVAFAISTEETRYYLNGAFFTSVDGKLNLIATNGHILAKHKTDIDYDGPDAILEHTAVDTILRMPTHRMTSMISVRIAPHKPKNGKTERRDCLFSIRSDWTFDAKTIDGKFPDWTRVIPKPSDATVASITQAMVSRMPAHDTYDRAILDPDTQTLIHQPRTEQGHEIIDMPMKSTGQRTSFAARYLRQIVGTIGDITLMTAGKGEPARITGLDPDVLVVLMPVRLMDSDIGPLAAARLNAASH